MERVINDYISREIVKDIVKDPALLPPSNEASLAEGGILDSQEAVHG
jgi:hypothetical protein